jgi:hypothetical protein
MLSFRISKTEGRKYAIPPIKNKAANKSTHPSLPNNTGWSSMNYQNQVFGTCF